VAFAFDAAQITLFDAQGMRIAGRDESSSN